MLMASSLLAAPSPIDDEEFLLFLAENIEKDGEWIDPLSMIQEDAKTETYEPKDNDKQEESNHE